MRILFSFVLAFLMSFATTPLVKNIAEKLGAVDRPMEDRRVHDRPIPRMGGLAIFYGFMVSVLCFCPMTTELRGILIGSVIIAALGVLDDIKSLSAKVKLPVQILAALAAVLHGVTINRLSMPSMLIPEGYIDFGIWAIPITIIWIIAVTNAVNLIDGLDGLAVGICTIASASLLCIALLVAEIDVAVMTAAITGCCFGFLPYNYNPAKIFMGDTGSTFLGYILATVSVIGLFKGYAVISFAAPLLVLGLPIFDTGFAILRRLVKRKPIMSPDRGHLHHRLLDMGFTQKQAVLIICIMSTILGFTAVLLIGSGVVRAVILICSVLVALILAAQNMNMPIESMQEPEEEKQ